jgi:putative ABC transport system permease protein
VRRIASLPDVRAVSWAGSLPLSLESSRRGVFIEGYQRRQGEDMEFHYHVVGPGFLETMEIPLVRGRDLTSADRAGAPGAVIVNEAFARRFWPNTEALGKRISTSGDAGPFLEVVGVIRDGRFNSLAEDSPPMVLFSALQDPTGTKLLVRTTGDPLRLLPAVKRELEAVDPSWSIPNARTMEQHIGNSILPQRIAGTVLGIFGFVALLLVAVGLYGVIAYSVATRTREIGVRIALGAQPRAARWFVIRQGAVLVGMGVAIALPVAWAVMRLLGGFLIGTSAADPVAFVSVAATLGFVALLASYVPARRASRVDPMVALRSE